MSAADVAYKTAKARIAKARRNGTKSLDFNTRDTRALTRLPPEIGTLTNLTSLALNNTQVTDLTPLQGLTALQELFLTSTQVTDLAPLHGLTGLHCLYLNSTPVTDLAPLQGLTGLQTLSLDSTQVTDLAPLQGLTELQRLDLDNTQVTDLTPLQGLTGLRTLTLNNTQVTDLAPLKGLTGLQRLWLNSTPVTDLTPLQGLTALQTLYLNSTQVADLRPIRDLTSLIEGAKRDDIFDPGLRFANTPATRADPELSRMSLIVDNPKRTEKTLTYLRTLPPWPEPLAQPPRPSGEPKPPSLDPALPIVITEDRLDIQPEPTAPDPITDAALEELRRLIALLSRKANQHDDLRGLTDRAKALLDDVDVPPDALRLHLTYQGLRRLHSRRETRTDRFDDETIAALDGLQDCVPGITLGNDQVQVLLDRQRRDQQEQRPGIDRAREDAILRLITKADAPVTETLREVAGDVLKADPKEPLGATRSVLSRNVVIRALMVAGAGSVGVGTWVLTQSPEIQSLAASIGDDAYWWAERIIRKLRALFEARAPGP